MRRLRLAREAFSAMRASSFARAASRFSRAVDNGNSDHEVRLLTMECGRGGYWDSSDDSAFDGSSESCFSLESTDSESDSDPASCEGSCCVSEDSSDFGFDCESSEPNTPNSQAAPAPTKSSANTLKLAQRRLRRRWLAALRASWRSYFARASSRWRLLPLFEDTSRYPFYLLNVELTTRWLLRRQSITPTHWRLGPLHRYPDLRNVVKDHGAAEIG